MDANGIFHLEGPARVFVRESDAIAALKQGAIQAGDVDVHETLKESGRGTSSRQWLRSFLVVGEVATTLVLLIAAGLMIRSFYLLQKVNPGFSHE